MDLKSAKFMQTLRKGLTACRALEWCLFVPKNGRLRCKDQRYDIDPRKPFLLERCPENDTVGKTLD